MTTRQSPTDRHQLQQIVAGLTEGVILVDEGQDIVWANEAALSMHGVKTLLELGTTVDQYHERFRLQYRNNHRLSKGDYPIERVIKGEAFRDVIVEVTPPGVGRAQLVPRVRRLVQSRKGRWILEQPVRVLEPADRLLERVAGEPGQPVVLGRDALRIEPVDAQYLVAQRVCQREVAWSSTVRVGQACRAGRAAAKRTS